MARPCPAPCMRKTTRDRATTEMGQLQGMGNHMGLCPYPMSHMQNTGAGRSWTIPVRIIISLSAISPFRLQP